MGFLPSRGPSRARARAPSNRPVPAFPNPLSFLGAPRVSFGPLKFRPRFAKDLRDSLAMNTRVSRNHLENSARSTRDYHQSLIRLSRDSHTIDMKYSMTWNPLFSELPGFTFTKNHFSLVSQNIKMSHIEDNVCKSRWQIYYNLQ